MQTTHFQQDQALSIYDSGIEVQQSVSQASSESGNVYRKSVRMMLGIGKDFVKMMEDIKLETFKANLIRPNAYKAGYYKRRKKSDEESIKIYPSKLTSRIPLLYY